MGKKGQGKRTVKSTACASKNGNNITPHQSKELNTLVERLLTITSVFKPNINITQSWELHLEISEVLEEINRLESVKNSVDNKDRREVFHSFVNWLENNGAKFEGIEISEFPGYDFGLKAKKEYPEGSPILRIPRKLMLTEDNTKQPNFSVLFEKDPLLQHMPNIRLALYLLVEKFSTESFWKPYIEVLPSDYTTVLYFSPENLEYLKPSPVFLQSLKLCRSIARQYAYFYKKLNSSDDPVAKNLCKYMTYNEYRWAVSTIMTRQNSIPSALAPNSMVTALIPLWDMCNHTEGKITTDFNPELDSGECFALRDYKPGDQIFIFYGLRSNADLLLHNGFVYAENSNDSLSLSLGVGATDALKDLRNDLLHKIGLSPYTEYYLSGGINPLTPELLAFLRVFNMNKEDLNKWLLGDNQSDLLSSSSEQFVKTERELEKKTLSYLSTRCNLLLAAYQKNVKPSTEVLTNGSDAPSVNVYRNIADQLKVCEQMILKKTITYVTEVLGIIKQ